MLSRLLVYFNFCDIKTHASFEGIKVIYKIVADSYLADVSKYFPNFLLIGFAFLFWNLTHCVVLWGDDL